MVKKVNYQSLYDDYHDNNLMYKKIRILDKYIISGESFLDVGKGVGELIELERQKYDSNIFIYLCSTDNLECLFKNKKFDYIICLDVLEYIEISKSKKAHIKDDGKLFLVRLVYGKRFGKYFLIVSRKVPILGGYE